MYGNTFVCLLSLNWHISMSTDAMDNLCSGKSAFLNCKLLFFVNSLSARVVPDGVDGEDCVKSVAEEEKDNKSIIGCGCLGLGSLCRRCM